jgi:Ca2+-binding EF-hand superfamily protein
LIDVFNHTPARLKGDSNNSDAFKACNENISRNFNISKDRSLRNLKKIHMKIEEKFKDYRRCFRSFEKVSDRFMKLNEFAIGCENIGIRLSLEEFKHVYNLLDSEQTGNIDFSQFCKINSDKPKDFA